MPKKEEPKGREYCKLQIHVEHLRILSKDRINKDMLKFPEKNKTMMIDEDPFPLSSQSVLTLQI